MKTRLNLTIEENLLHKIKSYAAKHKKSVSEIVEEYFEKLSNSSPGENIVDFMQGFKKSDIPEDWDLTEKYYEEKGKKYGF